MGKKNESLSPPWDIYVSKVKALFKGDKEVVLKYDEDERTLNMFVSSFVKAEALNKIMPKNVSFGNVSLIINIITPDDEISDIADTFRAAFKDNPNVTDIVSIKDPFDNYINYMIFKKEVVQFYDDDISDIYGLCSTLNEDIAREVFSEFKSDIRFCTDIKNPTAVKMTSSVIGHPSDDIPF